MKDGKHTLNNLRSELAAMSTDQKKTKLEELQRNLFVEYAKEKSHAIGGADTRGGPRTCWVLRRCIAMVKTSLHMEGYHYHPR